MKLDVLLTDGDYKNTYAIVRALKEKGLKVGVLFNYKPSLSFFSRLVDKRFFIKTDLLKSSDEKAFGNYKSELFKILKNNKIDVFMPVGNVSFKFASEFKNEIEQYCKLPVANKNIMKLAQDKNLTFEYAKMCGLPIPATYSISNKEDLDELADKINFPCVIKKTNYNESGVIYCNSKNELFDNYNRILKKRKKNSTLPIIQEYIVGPGMGFYGIYNEGKCCGYFMHQRIHEFPITGGASTMAKSIYDTELKELGDTLLRKLNWHGVAMVEFKKDLKDNKYKLMEINPKFWGSYELSHKAGINFSYMAYLLAMGIPIPESNYENGVYFRWTLPHDIVWYKFASDEQRNELKSIKSNVKIYNNIHWDDPLTVFYNLFFTVFKLIKEKKYPHGHIQ